MFPTAFYYEFPTAKSSFATQWVNLVASLFMFTALLDYKEKYQI